MIIGTKASDDQALSIVVGVLDYGSGFRVVVTHQDSLHHHIADGERAFIVPGMQVYEPVPWDDIPFVIRAARAEANMRLAIERKNIRV